MHAAKVQAGQGHVAVRSCIFISYITVLYDLYYANGETKRCVCLFICHAFTLILMGRF